MTRLEHTERIKDCWSVTRVTFDNDLALSWIFRNENEKVIEVAVIDNAKFLAGTASLMQIDNEDVDRSLYFPIECLPRLLRIVAHATPEKCGAWSIEEYISMAMTATRSEAVCK